jgi:hypothetical protein
MVEIRSTPPFSSVSGLPSLLPSDPIVFFWQCGRAGDDHARIEEHSGDDFCMGHCCGHIHRSRVPCGSARHHPHPGCHRRPQSNMVGSHPHLAPNTIESSRILSRHLSSLHVVDTRSYPHDRRERNPKHVQAYFDKRKRNPDLSALYPTPRTQLTAVDRPTNRRQKILGASRLPPLPPPQADVQGTPRGIQPGQTPRADERGQSSVAASTMSTSLLGDREVRRVGSGKELESVQPQPASNLRQGLIATMSRTFSRSLSSQQPPPRPEPSGRPDDAPVD